MDQEGVIKYRLAFKNQCIHIDKASLASLNNCRQKLLTLGLIGQDEARYEGYGFGNISFRCIKDYEAFWISGTQTGHLESLKNQDLCLVTQSYPEDNTVVAQGEIQPSSESMTHSVLYQVSPRINAVIHVHSPNIWERAKQLNLPSTPAEIPYGTPEMAKAVEQIALLSMDKAWPLVFSMEGHQDGIVAAGETLNDCTKALIQTLELAKS